MKKVIFFFSTIILTLMIIPAAHGWRLYDNFNSGGIDPAKWSIDQSSAIITVENGMAKFVHQSGHPNDSSWLIPIIKTNKIKGIMATVIFQGCDSPNQDVKGRIAANIGPISGDPNTVPLTHLSIEPYFNGGNTPYI